MTNRSKPIIIWLFTGAVMIFIMTAIGGITRLTESGLSMVDWNLIMGAIPPMTEAEWQHAFEQYQQYPEYTLKHFHFTLEDFKSIFFWEYFHRLFGRLIGLVFIIPFIIFLIQKRIQKPLFWHLHFLLFLGGFQGFLGWYMVSSGLVNEPRVSHFRLAAHLSTAFITISYSVWLALRLLPPSSSSENHPKNLVSWTWGGLFVLGLQIVFGAFVAGKDAGMIHNFWPNMNPGEFISPIVFSGDSLAYFYTHPSAIQFVHRYLAYVVAAVVVGLWVWTKKSNSDMEIQKRYSILLIVVMIQFTLGILTLIMHVPVVLGVLHQLGALVLLMGFVYALSLWSKPLQ
jgi:cytochrome c oxidase assembly protein subunit 15